MSKSDLCDLTMFKFGETVRAVLVGEAIDTPREKRIWLPKSQIEIETIREALPHVYLVEVTMPVWLAKEKELI